MLVSLSTGSATRISSFVSAVSAPSRTTQSLRTSGLGCGSHAWGPAVVVAARFLQSCRRVAGTCRRQRNTGSCAISQTRAEELCDESGDLAGDLGQRLTTDRQKPTFPEAQKLHVCLLKQGFVRLAGFASPEDASAVRELYWAAEAQRSGDSTVSCETACELSKRDARYIYI
ncbi:unnamed protein product [Polarella glacialis]|uniref:Uncharacterized protein n=1 Tax=Polarella glacialis TaxID=89957 RepID=A0A813KY59_POLGL|nr:unnamed protein product [Polarella glacialis]